MDLATIQSLWTILVLIVFLGIVYWAFSSRRKQAFDEAASLPFDNDGKTERQPSAQENDNG